MSFDIDGTLELGDPPGPIAAAFVRQVKARGWVVGTCSDRTVREQRQTWSLIGVEPDFVVVKTGLDEVRRRFAGLAGDDESGGLAGNAGGSGNARLIHIGDTAVDELYARRAGFEFVHVSEWREDAFT